MKTKLMKILGPAIFGIFLIVSCQEKKTETASVLQEEKSDIEVIYFYGKQRCASCKAMEKFAKEAIDSVFLDKLKDGTLTFKSVDITTPEGEMMADLFEVTASSIFIVDNTNEIPERVDMTAFGFRNARNNRQVYKQGIIDQINKFID